MAAGWFRADPYDAEALDHEGTEVDFGQLLKRIEKLPLEVDDEGRCRWGEYGGGFIVMDNFNLAQPIHGTIFMAKTRDLPLVGGVSGIAPPALKADQGIGKHVAFLWDRDASVLWFQRDRNAVGVTALRDYVMHATGVSLSIVPRLHPDAVARVSKIKHIKRMELTFTGRKDGKRTTADQPTTLNDMMDLRERLGAATIEVTVKPSRGKFLGPGSGRLLRETARLVRDGFQELRGAKVLGVADFNDDEEADWQTVDLLRDKMHFEVPLEVSRFRDPKALMAAIKRLWHDYRSEV